MNTLDSKVLQQIESLKLSYIRALDQLNVQGWLQTFAQSSGSYTCISEENDRKDLPIAFMLDDCYARLQDRVIQVVDIQSDTIEHYQMRHFTQLVSTHSDQNQIHAEYHFSVYYTRRDAQMTDLLCVCRYQDIIIHSDNDQLSFLQRRAILDTNVLPRYLAYPV